jgi:hypothetical protein
MDMLGGPMGPAFGSGPMDMLGGPMGPVFGSGPMNMLGGPMMGPAFGPGSANLIDDYAEPEILVQEFFFDDPSLYSNFLPASNNTPVLEGIVGTSINDNLTGTISDDTIHGLLGNDTLDGGIGADTLNGGFGDDTYVIDNVGDVINENSNFRNGECSIISFLHFVSQW